MQLMGRCEGGVESSESAAGSSRRRAGSCRPRGRRNSTRWRSISWSRRIPGLWAGFVDRARKPAAACLPLVALALACFASPAGAAGAEKKMLGQVEEVMILPWRIILEARVDTGAATSSVDARGIRVRGPEGARTVQFTLVGNGGQRTGLELPLVDQRPVATGGTPPKARPVVRMDLCVAGTRVPTEFTLNDRSHMEYRMILGRNLLEGRYVVDVSRILTTKPSCPAER